MKALTMTATRRRNQVVILQSMRAIGAESLTSKLRRAARKSIDLLFSEKVSMAAGCIVAAAVWFTAVAGHPKATALSALCGAPWALYHGYRALTEKGGER